MDYNIYIHDKTSGTQKPTEPKPGGGDFTAAKKQNSQSLLGFGSMADAGVGEMLSSMATGLAVIAVVKKATWPDQQIIRGTLADIAEKVKDANITKTAMIVVGDVLDPGDFNASKLYDKNFKHEYR